MKSIVVVHFPFEKMPKISFEVSEHDTFEDLKFQVTKSLKKEISNWLFVEVLRGYERKINRRDKIINGSKIMGRLMMRESKEYIENGQDISIWTPIHIPKIIISKTIKLLSKLQKGFNITEKERMQCLKLHFAQDPLFEVYLKNQPCFTNNESLNNLVKIGGTSDHIIEFNKSLPITMHMEYSKIITFSSLHSSTLSLEISPYSSQGDFLGSKLSRRVLSNMNETSILSLILCSFSPLYSLGLVIIRCQIKESNRIQYVIFTYNLEVKMENSPSYWKINLSELVEHKMRTLGTGASSIVYEATLYGNLVACKALKEQNNMGDISIFRREIENLGNINLRHPNVITFLGASEKRPYRIITEKLKYSLQTMLETTENFSYFNRFRIALDIIFALHHLHRAGFVHRDLKSANVMISDVFRAKIGDLGFTEYIGLDKTCKGMVGTYPWMAPEVCDHEYGFESDIYSLGVTLFELFSFKTIYCHGLESKENFKVLNAIEKWRKSPEIEKEGLFVIGKLIKNCCNVNPSKRPRLDKIIAILKTGLKKTRKGDVRRFEDVS